MSDAKSGSLLASGGLVEIERAEINIVGREITIKLGLHPCATQGDAYAAIAHALADRRLVIELPEEPRVLRPGDAK